VGNNIFSAPPWKTIAALPSSTDIVHSESGAYPDGIPVHVRIDGTAPRTVTISADDTFDNAIFSLGGEKP